MNKIIWIVIFAISFLLFFSMIVNRYLNNYEYAETVEYSIDEKMAADEDEIYKSFESSPKSFNTFSTVLKYIKEILTIISMTTSILMFIKKK